MKFYFESCQSGMAFFFLCFSPFFFFLLVTPSDSSEIFSKKLLSYILMCDIFPLQSIALRHPSECAATARFSFYPISFPISFKTCKKVNGSLLALNKRGRRGADLISPSRSTIFISETWFSTTTVRSPHLGT